MGRELARGSCELRPQGVQLYSHIWLSCMHAYCMYVAKNPSKILHAPSTPQGLTHRHTSTLHAVHVHVGCSMVERERYRGRHGPTHGVSWMGRCVAVFTQAFLVSTQAQERLSSTAQRGIAQRSYIYIYTPIDQTDQYSYRTRNHDSALRVLCPSVSHYS